MRKRKKKYTFSSPGKKRRSNRGFVRESERGCGKDEKILFQKRARKNALRDRRTPKLEIISTGRNIGYCFEGKKRIPVINIHGRIPSKNLTVKHSCGRIHQYLRFLKEKGHSLIYFIHGRSRKRGWKDFLRRVQADYKFSIKPFFNENGKVNESISVLSF